MHTVYNAGHAVHAATHEFFRGRLVPAFEIPARADYILQALQTAGLGDVLEPVDHGRAPLERVHAPRYLRFIEGAHTEWLATGGEGDAFPAVWPVRTLRSDVEPASFAARMGLYSMDSGTPLTAGTWTAAKTGADCAVNAAHALRLGERGAFVLSRPPGHHAGADFFGGYCFLNNAALAAQHMLDDGARKVAIIDIDYHHGNGTQAIFYDRADVFYASLHGDPRTEFPFFLGHADETGIGEGAGFNANFPLPVGVANEDWFAALDWALARLAVYQPELLIVSLGVDTYGGDPISHFKLDEPEFRAMGRRLAAFGAPTLFIQEGGYATAAIGRNVVAVYDR